jgi:uncharacterized membrane protein
MIHAIARSQKIPAFRAGSFIALTSHDKRSVHMNLTSRSMRAGVALGLGTVAGIAAVQYVRSRRRDQPYRAADIDPSYLCESITINQPIERVYQAWTSLESVAFLQNAQITDARDQESCAWISSDDVTGIVRFQPAPGARGTEVHVELTGKHSKWGTSIARVVGMAPDQQVREDLRRFKQLLETGEITLSDGASMWRPAQPAANPAQITAFGGGSR